MTNVDVAALAAELSGLLKGARLEKAYQPAKDQVLLRLRRKGVGRIDLIMQLGRYVTATRKPPDNPDKPSMVAQIIRSEYGNGRVKSIQQIGFDRLMRIDVQRGDGDRAIVFELFGDGNMLLLDHEDTILLPMRGAEHGARRLKKGEAYVPPPGASLPFSLDHEAFTAALAEAKRDVVRFLALDLGFGPLWAEELCLRASVPKNTKVGDVDDEQARRLHDAVIDLGRLLADGLTEPALVFDEGELVDAVPLRMQRYPSPRFQFEEAETFRAALDRFYRGTDDEEADEDPRQRRYDEAVAKVRRQVDQMQGAIDGFEQDEAAARLDAETLYLRFQEVDALLKQLNTARAKHSWHEIADTLSKARAAGDEAAAMVSDLRPEKAEASFVLEDQAGQTRQVPVDMRLSVQENADACYARAKKARSRREGAAKALDEAKTRLADIEAKGLDGFGAARQKTAGPSRHFWFENYRWCPLPDGFMAVGGRNAGQNDAVVKKYMRDGDRYVHADVHGAPSIVVRAADGSDREPTPEALHAAGALAVAASRAWRHFGQASAYWVTAAQVSKTPRSGEFVPKGAWIVHGRRNSMEHLEMAWAVAPVRFNMGGVPLERGVDEPEAQTVVKLAGGPPEALAAYAEKVVRMTPGDMDPNEAAALLAERFDVPIEEAQAVLPGGPVAVEGP